MPIFRSPFLGTLCLTSRRLWLHSRTISRIIIACYSHTTWLASTSPFTMKMTYEEFLPTDDCRCYQLLDSGLCSPLSQTSNPHTFFANACWLAYRTRKFIQMEKNSGKGWATTYLSASDSRFATTSLRLRYLGHLVVVWKPSSRVRSLPAGEHLQPERLANVFFTFPGR